MKTLRPKVAGLTYALLLGTMSLAASASANAAEPKALDCSSNGHRFIAPLAEASDI